MKQLLFAALLSLSLAACQKDKQEPQPDFLPAETKDWLILRAPDNNAVEAVAGDIDGTLTIATRNKIYLTKDRGKTWLAGDYEGNFFVFGLLQQQDTLIAMSQTMGYQPSAQYAIDAVQFSLDQGLHWRKYVDKRGYRNELQLSRNRFTTATGTEYRIEYSQTPVSSSSTAYYVESIGIETSAGQHITLPGQHRLNSIYFDAKSRLYIASSAPLCGMGNDFKFCGGEKGTLYVSKQPLL
ncbi:hypothetical protein [Hymenobacter psychrophilus]|uniref:Uncharacterized protein n=1 Tax=Hymenobacter psychrophilus TaxID=651662 RepID=A0A1H3ESY4_9BACT|nr:hypothetical protein [Hymenobacter psychrophilus]SDX81198.1 hypothetical protein SAMN04488069_103268 [Hymenobacter psychrophilus]